MQLLFVFKVILFLFKEKSNAVEMPLMKELQKAVEAIKNAKALIITAGSGLGVDSGLPDFRGPQGFWRAYPPLEKLNIQLAGMSNPQWFDKDPSFAWGFFGHRYNLYKGTEPHRGFQILLELGKKMELGYFVYTSNVDGHFQKAGFDPSRVCECHGTINYMQLVDTSKNSTIWEVPEDTKYNVDNDTLRLIGDLPMGPPEDPKHLARPNIYMFGDWGWLGGRSAAQTDLYCEFAEKLLSPKEEIPFVVIEIGSGLAVPTVRVQSEDLVHKSKGVLIRINPNESQVPNPAKNVSLPMGGLQALEKIKTLL